MSQSDDVTYTGNGTEARCNFTVLKKNIIYGLELEPRKVHSYCAFPDQDFTTVM